MSRFSRWLLPLATSGVLFLVGCSSEQPAQGNPPSDVSVSPTVSAYATQAPRPSPPDPRHSSRGPTCSISMLVISMVPAQVVSTTRTSTITGSGRLGEHRRLGRQQQHGRRPLGGDHVWDVDEVFAHPCQWRGRKIQPGRPSPVSRRSSPSSHFATRPSRWTSSSTASMASSCNGRSPPTSTSPRVISTKMKATAPSTSWTGSGGLVGERPIPAGPGTGRPVVGSSMSTASDS